MESTNKNIRRIRTLCVLALILASIMAPWPSEAHYPGVVLSGVGTATIDGVMRQGEWDYAGRTDYLASVRLATGTFTTPVTLFVMNDWVNLYFAIKIKNCDFGTISTSFEFDNDHHGMGFEEGDDVFVVNVRLPGPAEFYDDFRTSKPPCPPESICGSYDVDFGGTNDGKAAASDDGEFTYIEICKPLDSRDHLHDFSLKPGETVGFNQFLRFLSPDIADTNFPPSPSFGDIVLEMVPQEFETISIPDTPKGPVRGLNGIVYTYTTGEAVSGLGDPIEYRFDWGDGAYCDWSPSPTASKSWSSAGIYAVRAKARCSVDTDIESEWSGGLNVTVSLAPDAPDLTGTWTKQPYQRCKETGWTFDWPFFRVIEKCNIKGTFQVKNSDHMDSPSTGISFYLSADNILDKSDTLVKQQTLLLKAMKRKNLSINYWLPTDYSAKYGYLIAVINLPDDIDATNNCVASEPIK